MLINSLVLSKERTATTVFDKSAFCSINDESSFYIRDTTKTNQKEVAAKSAKENTKVKQEKKIARQKRKKMHSQHKTQKKQKKQRRQKKQRK